MNKFIALMILFSSVAHSSIDTKELPHEISSKEVVYDLVPPTGFKKLKIRFSMSGTVDNEIASIEIDTGRAVYLIKSSQLGIDFAPNMNEVNFYRIGGRTPPEPIYFNIFHGAPQKMECGVEGLIYMQKAIKIAIYPTDEPTVENDNSFFVSCKMATELEGAGEK